MPEAGQKNKTGYKDALKGATNGKDSFGSRSKALSSLPAPLETSQFCCRGQEEASDIEPLVDVVYVRFFFALRGGTAFHNQCSFAAAEVLRTCRTQEDAREAMKGIHLEF